MCMHHFPLHGSSHPTSTRSPLPPSVSSDQATHPYLRQDADRSPWWCQFRGRGGLEGGGWSCPQNPSYHLGRLAISFANDIAHWFIRGGPFQSIYLCVIDLILFFHLPVLSNRSVLSFYWCSDIDPSWGLRIYSAAFFLSIPVWCPYHSPLPHFHLSCLHLLNGENFPLLDSYKERLQ